MTASLNLNKHLSDERLGAKLWFFNWCRPHKKQQNMQLLTEERMPAQKNYLQSSVIYQATVTRSDNNTTETYIGLTENDFKTRYRNQTASFRQTQSETLLNLANISRPSKTATQTTLFHGAFFHQGHPTIAQLFTRIKLYTWCMYECVYMYVQYVLRYNKIEVFNLFISLFRDLAVLVSILTLSKLFFYDQ